MLDVQWAAGFIEGEGSFSGSWRPKPNNREYFQPTFCVAQKDRQIIDELVELFEVHQIRVYVTFSGSVWRLIVNNFISCMNVYNLLRPYMHVQYKINQIELWRENLMNRSRLRTVVNDAE